MQDYWNLECRKEHGVCDKDQYENLRLIALRSTGCRRFCQCAHASTEIDGSVTYYWVAQICPAGTLFDDSLPAPVCNHEDSVQCPVGDQPDGDACTREHGTCNQYEYENIRLVALLSSDCEKFCQCAHASTELDGSVTYKWVEKTCPSGTLFDESLPSPVCNHAYQVTCGASSRPGSSSGPVYTGNNGSTSKPVSNDACRREHGTCTQEEYENVRLVPLVSSGCEKFCQCAHASTLPDGSVTYYWVEHSCPAGTLFDASLPAPVCNFAHLVTCIGGSPAPDDDACEAEHGSCSNYEYSDVRLVALKSSRCEQFCQCAHASTELDGSVTRYWVKQTCPAGTLFDNRIRVCNWGRLVQC